MEYRITEIATEPLWEDGIREIDCPGCTLHKIGRYSTLYFVDGVFDPCCSMECARRAKLLVEVQKSTEKSEKNP